MDKEREYRKSGEYGFEDIVDIERLKKMFVSFSRATGYDCKLFLFPTGEKLIGTGYPDICGKYHRKGQASEALCRKSSIKITEYLKKAKNIKIEECEHGLVRGAAPILVEGVHLADLFVGQVFFEEPDAEIFRKKAEDLRYDPRGYFSALHKVPVADREEFREALLLLRDMIIILAERGLDELRTGQAALAARKSEENLHTTLRSIGDAVISTDMEGRIVHMNPVAEDLTGWKAEEGRGRQLTDVFHIVNAGTGREAPNPVTRVLEKGHTVGLANHTRLIARDGKGHQIADSASPIKDSEGNITGVVLVFRDVTEEYQKNRKIKETVELLSVIFRSIQDGMSVLSSDLEIQYVNPVMEQRYSDKMPLVGRKCFFCYQDRESPCQPCPSIRCMKSGKTESDIVAGPGGPESAITWFELYSYPIKDTDTGEVAGAVEFVRDITERVVAQEKLRKSRRRLARTEKIARVGSWEWEREHDRTIWSEEMFRIFGMDPSEGAPSWAEHPGLYSPEDFERLSQAAEEAISGGTPYELELKAIRKDGEPRICLARGFAERDSSGRTVRLYGSLQDITESKRAEEKLLQSTELLSATLESTNNGILVVDRQGRVLAANEKFRQMWHIDSEVFEDAKDEKLLGYVIGQLADPEEFLNKVEELYNNPERASFDTVYFKDGRIFERYSQPLWIKERVAGRVWSFRDITERAEAVESLKESEERYRTLVSAMSDIIFLLDGDNRFLDVHCKPGNALYAPAETFPGKRIEEVLPPQITRMYFRTAEKVRSTGRTHRYEYPLNIDNRDMWFVATLDLHEDGEKIIVDIRDITQRKKAEEALQRMQRLESVGTLAGGIAHDFNNILTGVYGNIELAGMKLPEDHEASRHIRTAGQSLNRAKHLTKQLLTFARGGEPLLEAVDIRQIVRDSVQFDLSGSSIKAHLLLPDDLWKVKADRGQISHVFANLIINAKEAMPMGGFVHIEAENVRDRQVLPASSHSGDYVRISIRDEGVGIPEDMIKRVFDPYFTTKQSGSGLGLAIAHSIVSKHGGHISVRSEPGEGATFTLFLPAAQSYEKNEEREKEGSGEEKEAGLRRVLVMDDEETVRNVSTRMLEAFGYSTDVAADGEETLKKYRESLEQGKPFDVVIVDLTIPGGMGGKEVTRELLDAYPDAKIIVTSGYSTDPVLANYGDYGFVGRIVKPFQMEELKREIKRVINM